MDKMQVKNIEYVAKLLLVTAVGFPTSPQASPPPSLSPNLSFPSHLIPQTFYLNLQLP